VRGEEQKIKLERRREGRGRLVAVISKCVCWEEAVAWEEDQASWRAIRSNG
jgi:hypothetical protein